MFAYGIQKWPKLPAEPLSSDNPLLSELICQGLYGSRICLTYTRDSVRWPKGAGDPMTEPGTKPRGRAVLSGPVTMGEFRARLAEMADRVLAGEEVTVLRGSEPVAKFVPVAPVRKRRIGVLKEMISAEELERLVQACEAPLSENEQRVLEGEGTDEFGIWLESPEDRGRESSDV